MNDRQRGQDHRKRSDDRGYQRDDVVFENKRMRRENKTYERHDDYQRDDRYDNYHSRGRDQHFHDEEDCEYARDGRSSYPSSRRTDEPRDDSRRCLECEKYPGAVKCNRCCNEGSFQEEEPEGEEVDEFGRSKKARTMQKTKTVWPPQFEESGSEFVLDYRSGMFYEAKSDFFYDPKTKLYYGNNNRTYYTYNTETKRFQKAEKSGEAPDPLESSSTDLMPIMDNSAFPSKNESNKTISIKLTTKIISKQAPKASALGSDGGLKVAKKHAVDMAKWSVRQTEKRAETSVVREKKIIRTVKGEPVCLVCRRKFKSVETFRLHQRSSQLHKSNLATRGSMKEDHYQYADRAQQRRELHDDFDTPRNQTSSVSPVATKDQKEDTGSMRKGESMLKSIGWKPDEGNQSDSKLRREWTRIEAIASRKGSSNSGSAGLGANQSPRYR